MSLGSKFKLPDISAPGDIVVGSYNKLGASVKNGGFVGDEDDASDMHKMMSEHASRSGGTLLPQYTTTQKLVKKKKAKTKTSKKEEPSNMEKLHKIMQTPLPPIPEIQFVDVNEEYDSETGPEEVAEDVIETKAKVKLQKVTFENNFGKIKMSVLDVIDSAMALIVVFNCEDDMIFVPKPGETIKFTDQFNKTHTVYYPDVLFPWIDHKRHVMILFKKDDDATSTK